MIRYHLSSHITNKRDTSELVLASEHLLVQPLATRDSSPTRTPVGIRVANCIAYRQEILTGRVAHPLACMLTCTCVDSRAGRVAKGYGEPLMISTHTLSTGTAPPVVAHSISSLRLAGQKQARWPVLHRRVASILVTTRCSNRSHLPHRLPTPPRTLASRKLTKV